MWLCWWRIEIDRSLDLNKWMTLCLCSEFSLSHKCLAFQENKPFSSKRCTKKLLSCIFTLNVACRALSVRISMQTIAQVSNFVSGLKSGRRWLCIWARSLVTAAPWKLHQRPGLVASCKVYQEIVSVSTCWEITQAWDLSDQHTQSSRVLRPPHKQNGLSNISCFPNCMWNPGRICI